MANRIFAAKPYNAKFIAMVDLFAFLLLIILYLYLTNPSQAELDAVTDQYTTLLTRNEALVDEYEEESTRNRELDERNRELSERIARIRDENEKRQVARAVLARRFQNEYKQILELADKKRAAAQAAGQPIPDPDQLILESALEWLAELSGDLAIMESRVAALTDSMSDQAERITTLMGSVSDREAEAEKLREDAEEKTQGLTEREERIASLYARIQELQDVLSGQGGKFRVAQGVFSGGDFKSKPVVEVVDTEQIGNRVARVLDEYNVLRDDYPYLFVIGHANQLDSEEAEDRSPEARLERNWVYAARRAAVIGRKLVEVMKSRGYTQEQIDKIVVVSTGELDLRNPDAPQSQENAWVEIIFGRDWKLPAADADKHFGEEVTQ